MILSIDYNTVPPLVVMVTGGGGNLLVGDNQLNWNSLTLNLHACIDIIKFKKAYKSTYMFTDNDAYF